MFLHNWETRSTSTTISYSKGKFVIFTNPNMVLNNGKYELTLNTCVYENNIKVDKFFNDLNTAVAYCEGRL